MVNDDVANLTGCVLPPAEETPTGRRRAADAGTEQEQRNIAGRRDAENVLLAEERRLYIIINDERQTECFIKIIMQRDIVPAKLRREQRSLVFRIHCANDSNAHADDLASVDIPCAGQTLVVRQAELHGFFDRMPAAVIFDGVSSTTGVLEKSMMQIRK